MARVFIHFDGDDLLREPARQGFRPADILTPTGLRLLEERFAQAVAGSPMGEVARDLARDAARQAGLCAGQDGDPDGGTGAALNRWPGGGAARDAF